MPPGLPLRVALDATPLLGNRTGIGRYVENLVAELAGFDGIRLSAAAFSLRGRAALSELPAGVRSVHRPVPARLLHRCWLRGDLPAAEWLTGRAEIVHGTNFVLPSPRRAAGVVTVHDLAFLRFPELVDRASLDYRSLVPRAVSRAARILVPTQAVADELSEAYPAAVGRLRVTPLGVDPGWFGVLPRPPAGLDAGYLLAVGTLEPRKGLDVLLQAYRLLLSAERELPPLVLVGPAGWGPELDTAGIPPERLVLPGFVDSASLRGLVAGASMLVYPSRYEGFGLPPLEALAAGTPVVASDLAPIREVAGEHLRLVPP
ncbi:MAG: glycosyltransferase family 4 protein, partial [Actinomycetota bacterium]|nr:glycosyltransferase family 4 protein [Actinomycetota bacterium]